MQRADAPATSAPAQAGASTLILNPVLMTEGVLGAVQVFEVSVFGSDQEPLAGQAVSLKSKSATGGLQTLTAVANASGKAIFSVTIAAQAREYAAESSGVGSNAVRVTPVATLP